MWVKHFVLSIITFTGGATTINVTDTCGQKEEFLIIQRF